MKQELEKMIRNLEQAKPECKHYEIGECELMDAINGKKIAKSDNQELSQALRYCLSVVGIRANNMPTQEETAILFTFLRRNFGGHTTDEVRLAFDMAAAGKLDVDGRHFENFSCEYVGRIMTGFRSWAKQAYIQNQPKKELPEPKAEFSGWGKIWEDYKERAKTQNPDNMVIPEPLADWLFEQGILKLTPEEEGTLLTRAKFELNEESKSNQKPTEQQVIIHAKVLAVRKLLKII